MFLPCLGGVTILALCYQRFAGTYINFRMWKIDVTFAFPPLVSKSKSVVRKTR